MTFGNLKKMFDVLNNGGEILVMEDIAEGQSDFDDECMREVEMISSESDILDCMKYFTESKYSLYVYEKDKPYYELDQII